MQDGRCKYMSSKSVGTDTGFVDVNPTEKDLKDALTKVGPVSIAIDASNWSFQNYAGGKLLEKSCEAYVRNRCFSRLTVSEVPIVAELF